MRPFTLALIATLTLAACAPADDAEEVDDADIEIAAEPEETGEPELVGAWVLTAQNGDFEEQLYLATFDPLGNYTLSDESGAVLRRETYAFAGDAGVTITDSTGATRYYEVDLGFDALTLRDTTTGASATFEPREDFVEDEPLP